MKTLFLNIMLIILLFSCTTKNSLESTESFISPKDIIVEIAIIPQFDANNYNWDSLIGYSLSATFTSKEELSLSKIKICINDSINFDSVIINGNTITTEAEFDSVFKMMFHDKDTVKGYLEHEAFGKINFKGIIPDLINEINTIPIFDSLQTNNTTDYTIHWNKIDNGEVVLTYWFGIECSGIFTETSFNEYFFNNSITSFKIPENDFLDSTYQTYPYFFFGCYSKNSYPIPESNGNSVFNLYSMNRATPYSNR